jgi:hypothetical protein
VLSARCPGLDYGGRDAALRTYRLFFGVAALVGLGLLSTLWMVPTDVAEYAHYAYQAVLHPGIAWPREYPPLALLLFLLPRLLPLGYQLGFALLSGAMLGLLVWVSRHRAGEAWSWRLLYYLLMGAVPLVTGRYDLFPSALLALAALDLRDERVGRAWLWSTVGAALKLFPLVIWPVLLIAEWRNAGRIQWWRPAASAAGLAALLTAPRAWGVTRLSWLGFLSARPPNVGSVAGGLTALIDPRFLLQVHFGSLDVIAPPMYTVGALVMILGALTMAGIYWAQWQGRLDPLAALLLALSVLILGSKVFSVQYLIWLVPLWAWYPVSRGWSLAALFNTFGYPLMYSLWAGSPSLLGGWLVASLAMRNLLLLAAAANFARGAWIRPGQPMRDAPMSVAGLSS